MCREVWGFESLRGHQKAFPGYPVQNAAILIQGLRRFSFSLPYSLLRSQVIQDRAIRTAIAMA